MADCCSLPFDTASRFVTNLFLSPCSNIIRFFFSSVAGDTNDNKTAVGPEDVSKMGCPSLGEHTKLEVVIEESYEFKVTSSIYLKPTLTRRTEFEESHELTKPEFSLFLQDLLALFLSSSSDPVLRLSNCHSKLFYRFNHNAALMRNSIDTDAAKDEIRHKLKIMLFPMCPPPNSFS